MPTRRGSITAFLFTIALFLNVNAQQPKTLATANGLVFTANDLSPEAKKLYDQQGKLIAENRKGVFDEWIFEELLKTEAKALGTTTEKIEAEALAKAPGPTDVQIKAVYDGNKQSLGARTLDEVRPNIIAFLKREAQGKQFNALFDALKSKYKFTAVKDAGAALKAAEIIATIGTRQITAGEFENANRIALYNYRAGIHEDIKGDLENAIYAKLLEVEAKKRETDAGSVIAAEVTNKLKEFTDYERTYLEDMLLDRLFRDYAVKFALPPLEKQVLNVPVDDDPSIGPATSKVTVVAFVDFQCSACAAFSPLMKKVIAEFGDNVRLVVRDFPLTEIHEHGMDAARAGFAARQQGKFFELGDVMYRNQDALDDESLKKYARDLGMNAEQFQRDMNSGAAVAEIRHDMADGNALGVNGTPSVFVNGVKLQRISASRLRELIKSSLN